MYIKIGEFPNVCTLYIGEGYRGGKNKKENREKGPEKGREKKKILLVLPG